MNVVKVLDTTLRDGTQMPGLTLSLHDKLEIAKRLDEFGVHYIEGGWPGSNPKDSAFFQATKKIVFKNATLVAFGMTCAKGKKPEEDEQLAKLVEAQTKVVTIVGKASKFQVEHILCTTLEENLRLIEETCRFLVGQGKEVFFDAEHFFDGWKLDRLYSLDCLKAAIKGGASTVVLCDTNGGSLPKEISEAIVMVKLAVNVPLGIHAHNDGGMAVANSLAAVEVRVEQVQVTVNGYGERCGNADLCQVVPALVLKMGVPCIPKENLKQLVSLSHFVSEVTNFPPDQRHPYVGKSAFRHKAGLHASAVAKSPNSYNHILPELVGNSASISVSELSGRSNVLMKAKEFGINLLPEQVKVVLARVEVLENQGFQFEDADGSLELIMMRSLEGYSHPFEILKQDVGHRRNKGESPVDSATVKVHINGVHGKIEHQVADGDGPVNALDQALRKCLTHYFPCIKKVELVDYKVRVLPGKKGTAKVVRVLIDFSDGETEWTTVGCSTDSIEASLQALADGLEYAILKAR